MSTKRTQVIRQHARVAGLILAAILLLTASAPAQNLFVADYGNGYSGNIYEFTPSGTRSTVASGLGFLEGLAFNSSGDLFAAGGGGIFEVTSQGTVSTFVSFPGFGYGLAVNSAGDLFVSEYYSGNIYEFSPNGTRSTFASGLSQPLGLAFNSAGDLFESDQGSGNIYEFTTNGVRSTFASGLNHPWGLTFNSAGTMFEADGSGNIYEFTTNGVRSTFASGLIRPNELAFNNAGNLFVADGPSGNIYEFTPSGTRSTFASGYTNPTGLAFQPPPLSTCPSIVGTWTGQMNVASAWGGYSTTPLTVQVTDQTTNGCLVRGFLKTGNGTNRWPNNGFGWNPWLRSTFTGAIPDGSTVLLNVSGVGAGKASAILDMSQTPPVLTKFVYQPENGATLAGDLTLQQTLSP